MGYLLRAQLVHLARFRDCLPDHAGGLSPRGGLLITFRLPQGQDRASIAAALLLACLGCFAQAPHQVAVLVNQASPRSCAIAEQFVEARGIPREQVLYLDVPRACSGLRAQISREEFTRSLWEPAWSELEARGLGRDRILAWVYAPDFPIRVVHHRQGLSLTGITFVRNRPPPKGAVRQGAYVSPLYAGPDPSGQGVALGQSLERYRESLGGAMPLPAMMLGYGGTRGETTEAMERRLALSARVDGIQPQGRVVFLKSQDVRTQVRAWQFEGAAAELRDLGMEVEITDDLPRGTEPLFGLMSGAPQVRTDLLRGGFVPGGYAETLTSFGALFHIRHQTKTTHWFEAGAFGSSGTVSEPLALWTKFPHARLFAHYRRGNTLLESLVQSVRCPLQILFLGDPLMRPFAPPWGVSAVLLGDVDAEEGSVKVAAQVVPLSAAEHVEYRFFLDGRPLGEWGPEADIDVPLATVSPGHHVLRTVAAWRGRVRHHVSHVEAFERKVGGRSILVPPAEAGASVDGTRAIELAVQAEGDPVERALLHQGRRIAAAAGGEGPLLIPAGSLRAGTVRLDPVALYADGQAVRGAPVSLVVEHQNRPPRVQLGPVVQDSDSHWSRTLEVQDPDGDPVEVVVARDLLPDLFAAAARRRVTAGADVSRFPLAGDFSAVEGWTVAFSFPPSENSRFSDRFHFGVARGAGGHDPWAFAGFHGEAGGWVISRVASNRWGHTASLGAPVQRGAPYTLEIAAPPGQGRFAVQLGTHPVFSGRIPGDLGETAALYVKGCTADLERLAAWPWPGIHLKSGAGMRYILRAASREDLSRCLLRLDDGITAVWHPLE